MDKNLYKLVIIFTVALLTFLLRSVPFILFPEGKKPPKMISYLSNVLPTAVMGMLIIYCLKNISLTFFPHALPEIISIALVAILYIWKRNTLLSIVLGTACYMILIQKVFI